MQYENGKTANVGVVKEHFSAYVAKAERGESTTICRRNRPVAAIVPVKRGSETNRTRMGSARSSVVVKTDLTEPAMDAADWGALS